MKINLFIFCILFEIFILKFLDKEIGMFKLDSTKIIRISSFKIKNGNIYFLYSRESGQTYKNSTLLEIDSEKDEIIKKSLFPGEVEFSSHLTNDINVFITLQNYIIFQKDGIFSEVNAGLSSRFFSFKEMSFNADSLLLIIRQFLFF